MERRGALQRDRVCALFNFYNKWIDASGVSDMPAAAYDASGQRLATVGYVGTGTP